MQAISEHTGVYRKPQQVARCTGTAKRQTTQRTCNHHRDGFLKHQFLPLYKSVRELPEQKKVESGFFTSLSTIRPLCSCEIMVFKDKPYPYNILLAHHKASQLLQQQSPCTYLSILQDDDDKLLLRSTEYYNTNNTLYYIPVQPLFRLLQNRKAKHSAEMLLSVFSYLYRIAGIPYYRDEDSDLYGYYDMIAEWTTDSANDEDETTIRNNISAINEAMYAGDCVQRKFYNAYHILNFGKRIENYQAHTPFEKECLNLASAIYRLYTDYPDKSIMDNMSIDEDAYGYDDEIIRASAYISFVAKTKGWLFDQVCETVNSYFNECCHQEQPIVRKLYDGDTIPAETNLDYERRLFRLIDDLCTLLNSIP